MEENLSYSDETVAENGTVSAEGAATAAVAPEKPKRRINQQKLQDNLWGWIFCIPLIIGTVWFVYYAFVLALILSFTAYDVNQGSLMDAVFNFKAHPEGWYHWYEYLFTYSTNTNKVLGAYGDPVTGVTPYDMNEMGRYLFNTVFYMIGIPIGMVLSVFFAVCMSRDIKGGNLFRVLYYLPCVASSIAIVYTFKIMFKPTGVINTVLGLDKFAYPATSQISGTGFQWIPSDPTKMQGASWNDILGIPSTDPRYLQTFFIDPFWCQGLISKCIIVIMSVWKGLGGTIILYVAGLSGVNAATKEAAQIDGANGWQIFWKVTMPDLYPVIFYNIVTSVIGGLQIYAEPELLFSAESTDAGFDIVSGYVALIYRYGLSGNKVYSQGAAYGMFLAVIIFVLTLFQFWLDGRRSD